MNFEKWKGTFEVDESFYGGKFINKRKAVIMELKKELDKKWNLGIITEN